MGILKILSLPIFSVQQLPPPRISLLDSNASVGIVLCFKAIPLLRIMCSAECLIWGGGCFSILIGVGVERIP